MVCGNCHAERFEQIDWPKNGKEKEDFKLTVGYDLPDFVELDNSEIIQLLYD